MFLFNYKNTLTKKFISCYATQYIYFEKYDYHAYNIPPHKQTWKLQLPKVVKDNQEKLSQH